MATTTTSHHFVMFFFFGFQDLSTFWRILLVALCFFLFVGLVQSSSVDEIDG